MSIVYKVLSLDIIGHESGECTEYDCSCVKIVVEIDGDERTPVKQHDDNRCECCYEQNAAYRVGRIKPASNERQDILTTMIAGDYLTDKATLDSVTIESCNENGWEVIDASNRKPMYELVLLDSRCE